MRKILVISHDIVGKQMAGPGIRYYHLARVLSKWFEVTLAMPCQPEPSLAAEHLALFEYLRGEWQSIESQVSLSETIILNGVLASEFSELSQLNIPLVIDGYDPLLAEWMTATRKLGNEQENHWSLQMERLTQQYLLGDYFLCASERQRDWWLGLLEANGRVNPWNIRHDPTLRKLIDVVPFGLPATAPTHHHPTIRNVWPGIGQDDKIILWGGGLWPWLDPITAIRAIEIVNQVHQNVRLIFPGTQHPNPSMSQMPSHVEEAQQLAGKLGLLDKVVFFGDWIPYQDWPNVLVESDIAISLHDEDSLETRWAFRTRILDYIWAGVPIVATRGDATSELIENFNLGILVPSFDMEAVANSILKILDPSQPGFQSQFEAAREMLTWENVASPLINFCRNPYPAHDKQALGNSLGNPYYLQKIKALETETTNNLEQLKQAYENRKIIRISNWLHKVLKPSHRQ